MDDIREQLNKPLVAGIAGGIIGLILGLIFAWGIWPVNWTDAPVELLRSDLQEQWLRMSIDEYVLRQNPVTAQQRYEALGENADEVLARVAASPGPQSPEAVTAFGTVVQAGALPQPGATAVGEPGAEATAEAGEEGAGLPGWMNTLLTAMCVVTLLLLAAVVVVFVLRGRNQGPKTAKQVMPEADWSDYSAAGEEPPMAQFMASFKLGDDLFDDSFSIDSPSGEFLGECGVGISETIGVGDPKKVTAFEVWLFDKNDIQTVTKVVMSEHAFEDDTIRQRLSAKGEPVLSNPGGEVVLETQTLQLVARVVDMSYGDGALPENSYFDNLVLQLAVWQK